MKPKIETVYGLKVSTICRQPYFQGRVPAGFPSPAGDYEEGQLDLNKHLVKNPPATFFVRVTGDSMKGAGIHSGDLLIVDRSLETRDKNIVIAVINGQLTVKRIRIRRKQITLEPENDAFPAQEISPDMDFQVWGIVTNVIHSL